MGSKKKARLARKKKKVVLTREEELQNFGRLTGSQLTRVKDLLTKSEQLKSAGMVSSSARLESEALKALRRYHGVDRSSSLLGGA